MVLAEALGTQEFVQRVRIYATDVDQDALDRGRHATYTTESSRESQRSSWSGTSLTPTAAEFSAPTCASR
jgi:chemotaxis methyl-accepting protein methylase